MGCAVRYGAVRYTVQYSTVHVCCTARGAGMSFTEGMGVEGSMLKVRAWGAWGDVRHGTVRHGGYGAARYNTVLCTCCMLVTVMEGEHVTCEAIKRMAAGRSTGARVEAAERQCRQGRKGEGGRTKGWAKTARKYGSPAD